MKNKGAPSLFVASLIVVFLFTSAASSSPTVIGSSPEAKRAAALKAIDACEKSNKGQSHHCKKLNANLQTLIDVYKEGDKTVLPTLFKFTYLTDFYGDAVLADPNGFLSAMGQLKENDQKAVASGIAGQTSWGLASKERFESIRAVLRNIPDLDANKGIAQLCLKELETRNASFLVTYFPPQTFNSMAGDFQVRWYLRDMYALGEKPLWPVSSEQGTTYRLTYLPAFTGPTVITFTANSQNARGQIALKSLDVNRTNTMIDRISTASPDETAMLLSLVDQSHFWTSPTELPSRGRDGAEWILEGVKDGQYRVVVRCCPDIERQSTDEIWFARAGQLLFELAGQKHTGGC